MTYAPKRDSVDSISATLSRIVRLSVSRSAFARQASAADTELSQPSYILLRVLIDEGPLPIGRLATVAHMDVGMATRRVRALADAGLVTRRGDPGDGRVSVIEATADGVRAAGSLHEVRRDHLARALSGWSAAELAQFDRLLARFLEDTTKTPIKI
ncbi:MarR family transcriptional regulator [Mycobacterium sp. IS-836]|uniref:MarR family winged helix-turn-helix transcriptional regulator n=1 Tax=Mycobacterium sp. IS-836 TaxID=1834160 RepID=UPI00096BF28F|nr:MarR family winged helix-turn-helix transcriptional regulator [Mycobacterium sp. IS-836]OMC55762.1 MarR family transcriptional regulator [Mycobacterium sp. IS-836]